MAKRDRQLQKPRYRRAVGPRLRVVLLVVFGLFGLLAVNSIYLASITIAESLTGQVYQDWLYLTMFIVHLILGLAITIPVIVFGALHMRNTYNRPNRRAVRVGYALFVTAILLLLTGFVLTRLEGVFEIRDPGVRGVAYWIHVIAPLVAVWLFILHRLSGRRIRWRVGFACAALAAPLVLLMIVLQTQDPRSWGVIGNPEGEQYFHPSLARTLDGKFIPATALMNDQYCLECHADVHASWANSVHRFSSFNNPPYLFSVRETRRKALARDGDISASRFCAGCHDPVPFFSGAFNDPNYDDVHDPTASAGITCTVCHVISNVNSPRGNADYTIEPPVHYPFYDSESELLQELSMQLVKAKPDFHKKTFLKPLHRTTEFCGACHKVHLPQELNDYKWLRGQNHYDTFLLSGVSGHSPSSFYYPPEAEENCNGCHMPLIHSDDFAARVRDDSGERKTLDHLFPGANTAVPVLADMPDPERAIKAHREILEDSLRVDIFGVRAEGRIDGALTAPLRPEVPALERGKTYLIEVVLRTLTLGHTFTEGTADSNEVWLEATAVSDERVIGHSGAMDESGFVDEWAHRVNAFVLDRNGRRIDRRNAEDIFLALYNNQIPPGAADVVSYALTVPRDAGSEITVDVALRFRKFDTEYMRYVYGEDYVNTLPIVTIATDRITFPVGGDGETSAPAPDIPTWQRFNDYGIGLLRKARGGRLRQAERAFERVEKLGRPDGPLNLARVYIAEGRVADDAPAALSRAVEFDPPAPPWTVLWLSGRINRENGRLERAIDDYRQILEGGFAEAAGRGFDFSHDYRVLVQLGLSLYERSRLERGSDVNSGAKREFLDQAIEAFDGALALDPENVAAHYNLARIFDEIGDEERATFHRTAHARYKVDDNARDEAFAAARRRYPAADRASESVVIYDLAPSRADSTVRIRADDERRPRSVSSN